MNAKAPRAASAQSSAPAVSGLSREMSLALDVIRFGAALLVMISHLADVQNGGAWLKIPYFGFVAVMVFFVLSGFVIGYVADEKEKSADVFIASRLARLWSVLIPALVLTAVLDAVGFRLHPAVYESWRPFMGWDHPALRLAAAAGFFNELWFCSIAPLSNAPAWSLGFEFWYYLLFAAWAFNKGGRRIAMVALVALIAGPKILLLGPAWLAGLLAWRRVRRGGLSQTMGWALLVAPLGLFCLLFAARFGWRLLALEKAVLGQAWLDRLNYGQEFLWAWILSALTALSFVGLAAVAPRFGGVLNRASRPIRAASALTLSLYMVHMPVLVLASAALSGMAVGPVRTLISALAALAVTWAFAAVFEKRKDVWRRIILRLLAARPPKAAPAI